MSDRPVPYWRLASFYFFYFAIFGAWGPYWSLYLDELGISPLGISVLFAAALLNKIVAPNLWGAWADRSGRRLTVIRVGAGLAAVFFIGMLFELSFLGLLFVSFAYSFFWNAVLAQFEDITLRHLGPAAHRYGRIRLWGSIGFIGMVLLLGVFFDHAELNWLPAIILALLCLLWLSSLATPNVASSDARSVGYFRDAMQIIARPAVAVFFVVCFLNQLGHGAYYTFFSLYLREFAYSKTMTGALWAAGVVFEVVLFLFAHRLLGRFSLSLILTSSLLLATLRWLLIAAAPQNLALLLFAQVLHTASFASVHLAGIRLVQRVFGSACSGQGQAFYSALGYGAGAGFGALLAGLLWDIEIRLVFVAAALFSSVGALLSLYVARHLPEARHRYNSTSL